MGKIGDLWVKLGLKNEGFKDGMKESQEQVQGFGKKLDSMKAIGVAVWAAMTAAVVKFAKDAVALTQKWGDQWNQTMEGVKGAYSAFVRQLSSGEGWSNLFQNMREAYKTSKEVAAALDEIFERRNSYNITEAVAQKEISALELIMRDASRSDAERKKAAEDLIKKERELADIRRGIIQDEAAANRKQFMSQTGLNDYGVKFMVDDYEKNRAIIGEARDYLGKLQDIQGQITALQVSGAGSSSIQSLLQQEKELVANTSPMLKHIATMVQQYDKGNDEIVKSLVESKIAVVNVDTEANKSIMRANSLLGQFNKTAQETTQVIEPIVRDTEKLASLGGIMGAAITGGGGITGRDDFIAKRQEEMAGLIDYMTKLEDASFALADALYDGAVAAFDELANVIAGVEGSGIGSMVKALLSPLADMAVKIGTMIMSSGEAIEALKNALSNPFGGGPVAAVAMGAALVGIGVAMKAGLAAIGRGGSAAGSTTASSVGSYSGSAESMEMTIHIEGRLKGSDIVLAGQRTSAAWAR